MTTRVASGGLFSSRSAGELSQRIDALSAPGGEDSGFTAQRPAGVEALAASNAAAAALAGPAASTAATSGLSDGLRLGAAEGAAFASAMAEMKTGGLSHLDTRLSALVLDQQGIAGFGGTVSHAASAFTSAPGGKTYVTIDVSAADGDGAFLLHQLEAIGLVNGASFGGVASGRIEVGQLDALTHVADLGFARESVMTTFAGFTTTQADIAEKSDEARAEYGVDGSGLKIGVLSDSFDASHARDPVTGAFDTMDYDIANGDLPVDTTVLQDVRHGTDEGRAMAQLIHDLAPGAAIDFATANLGIANFANNILALAQAGADVIVDDVLYFAELAYQEGPIAQAIDQVVAGGATYFTSAGNDAREGLEQAWKRGEVMTFDGEAETQMNFAKGQDYVPLTLAAGASTVLVLQWDQPGASAGGVGSASDLDLFVTDASGATIFASSVDNNIGGDPVEFLGVGNDTNATETVYVRVGLASGHAPNEIKLMSLSNGAPVDLAGTARSFNDGTVYGHAGNSDAIATGAVVYNLTPEFRTVVPLLEDFSSGGPDRVWFDNDGNRLASPIDNPTPQISAVDGGNTTFFGFDYDSDGHPNFFGTSAAAPDAAAVALLMLEANGGLNATDIENLLVDSAVDMDDPYTEPFDRGVDATTGAGLIQADAAVGFAQSLEIANEGARALLGTHLNDHIHSGSFGQRLTGGGGSDVFVYDSVYDSIGVIFDTITDLENNDAIDVSAVDAREDRGGDQKFHLVDQFDHKPGEVVVRYHNHGQFAGSTTMAFYTNEDHRVDMLIIAQGDHGDFSNFVF